MNKCRQFPIEIIVNFGGTFNGLLTYKVILNECPKSFFYHNEVLKHEKLLNENQVDQILSLMTAIKIPITDMYGKNHEICDDGGVLLSIECLDYTLKFRGDTGGEKKSKKSLTEMIEFITALIPINVIESIYAK